MTGLTQIIISTYSRQLILNGASLGVVNVYESGVVAYWGKRSKWFKDVDEAADWLVEMRKGKK